MNKKVKTQSLCDSWTETETPKNIDLKSLSENEQHHGKQHIAPVLQVTLLHRYRNNCLISIDTYSPAFESTFQWTNNNTSLHIKQNGAIKSPFLGSRHCSDPTPLECTILSCLCEFSKIIAWYPFFNTFPIEWCILIFWPVGTPHHHLLPWPTAIPVSSLNLLQSCSDRPLHAFHNDHWQSYSYIDNIHPLHTIIILLISIYYTNFIFLIYIYSTIPTHLSHCLCVSFSCRPHESCVSILQVNTHNTQYI